MEEQLHDNELKSRIFNESATRPRDSVIDRRAVGSRSPLRELHANTIPSARASPIQSGRKHQGIVSHNTSTFNFYDDSIEEQHQRKSVSDSKPVQLTRGNFQTSKYVLINVLVDNYQEERGRTREADHSQSAYDRLSEKYYQIKNL